MTYLYGDSTPSTLESNFIEVLGDALDFSVRVLLAAERMKQLTQKVVALKQAADMEIARLEGIGVGVSAAVEPSARGGGEARTVACAAAVLASTREIVERHVGEARTALSGEIASVVAQDTTEREASMRALEAFLCAHDPPQTSATVHFLRDGQRYVATRSTSTPYGLEAVIELDVAAPHAFSQIARVDKIVPHLEVHAPESSGWLRKQVVSKAQRLEKHHLIDMIFAPKQSTLRLRSSLDGGAHGFDVEVRAEAPRVTASRVGEEGPEPFDLSDEDAAKLIAFDEALRAALLEAAPKRVRLRDAKLDGAAFAELPDPGAVVDRLVTAMAPVVQEIARHSLSPSELVLKRQTGDHRREEIFVSIASLDAKLVPLPEPLRATFRPLGLNAVPAPPPSSASVAPAAPPEPPPASVEVAVEAEPAHDAPAP